MLSLQVVSPSPHPSHISFPISISISIPIPFSFPILAARCSLVVCLVSLWHLNLTCLLGVSVAVLESAVFSLQSSRRIQSTVCILHCALAVQSTKCISASSMHLLCLPVSLPLSLCLSLPDQAFDRAHTISFFQCSLPCVRCNVCFCLFESQLKLFCTISARSSNLIGVWPLQL